MENPLATPPSTSEALEGRVFNRAWLRWFASLRDFITKQNSYTVTFNPASVAAASVSAQTVTVTGLTTNDIIVVNPPALPTGLALASAYASAANQATFVYVNPTAGAIDAGSGTYLVYSVRK